ncbi:hypothetical protein DCAR_0622814 [Daucus carota subsp. sativus]|uniref:Uncharacterized protein n=1 Tax=Daucus carota subsp. sativus TaxID=79200 RepID=A0A164UVZ4_DAUCS|nr:hypothetical protein DCAR_0622814 [Daucus carota subsp. sativus]
MVGNGVYAKDVLHNVLMESFANLLPNLGFFMSSASGNRAPDGLMDVGRVLLMGFGKVDKVGGVPMLGPSVVYRFSCYFPLGLRFSFKVVCNVASFVSSLFY